MRAETQNIENHPSVKLGKVGVMLVNLGTPDAPTPSAVRRYLAEFLADKRVVDYPRAFWLPVLYGVILNTRPAKTAKNYQKVWMQESDESPLRYFTRAQADKVSEQLDLHTNVQVTWAMRYGNPSIPHVMNELRAEGCDRILVVPLYPQYSATTTATVTDKVFETLKGLPWQPSIRIAPPFHDETSYIDALAQSYQAFYQEKNAPEQIILSFHGLPQRFLDQGDPYYCHCHKTARLLREKMGWSEEFAPMAFQSKFGPEKWLEPSTESMIAKANERGLKNIAVMTPGFVADCIETLEEIGIGLNEQFIEAGGEQLDLIPCLNEDESFIDCLSEIVQRELGGWV